MGSAPPGPESNDTWPFIVRFVFHPWSSLDWLTKLVLIGTVLVMVGGPLLVYGRPRLVEMYGRKRGDRKPRE